MLGISRALALEKGSGDVIQTRYSLCNTTHRRSSMRYPDRRSRCIPLRSRSAPARMPTGSTPAQVRVPRHACVTGTIQRVLQETRAGDRKKDRGLPYYRPSIAMREVVSYSGLLELAFLMASCSEDWIELLLRTGPAINYFG